MDGENGADVAEFFHPAVKDVEEYRNHGRLPVVAVDDLRLVVQDGEHLQHRLGEEDEPLRVVVKAVDAVALKVVFVIQQVAGDAVHLCPEEPAVLVAPGERDVEVGDVL